MQSFPFLANDAIVSYRVPNSHLKSIENEKVFPLTKGHLLNWIDVALDEKDEKTFYELTDQLLGKPQEVFLHESQCNAR